MTSTLWCGVSGFCGAIRRSGGGEYRSRQVNQRPREPGKSRSAPVRLASIKSGLLVPRKDCFDGELGKSLHPGEDREGKTLSNEELSGFSAPGDQDARRSGWKGLSRAMPRDSTARGHGDYEQPEAEGQLRPARRRPRQS